MSWIAKRHGGPVNAELQRESGRFFAFTERITRKYGGRLPRFILCHTYKKPKYNASMPIADVILSRISNAGFMVAIEPSGLSDSQLICIRATDPKSGRIWVASGVTLEDAAADLARQLACTVESESCLSRSSHTLEPNPTAKSSGGKWLGYVPPAIVLVLTAAIFLVDLITPGFIVGVLYLVPLSLATRSRLSDRSFILLGTLMIFLIYLDQLWEVHFYPGAPADPSADFNRGLAAVAVAVNSGIIILIRHGQSVYHGSSRREHALQVLRAIAGDSKTGETILRWMAAVLTIAIFAFDLVDPAWLNSPILYFVPLALIALIDCRIVLWRIVLLMVGLSAIGCYFSSNDFASIQQSQLIIANRLLVGVGLALVAIVLQVSARYLLEQPTRHVTPGGAG
jgi:hypothetical protein